MWLLSLFNTYGNLISTTVLTVTLVVLIFYTVATFGLKKATLEQNELRLTPWIIIEHDEEYSTLSLKNIGHSPALNVCVRPVDVRDQNDVSLLLIKFKTLEILEPQQTAKLGISIEPKNKEIEVLLHGEKPEIMFPLIPGLDDMVETYIIEVGYKNLKKTSFLTEIRVLLREKRLEVVEIRKVS